MFRHIVLIHIKKDSVSLYCRLLCVPVPVKKPRKRTTGIESAYLAQHKAMFSKILHQ